MSTAVWSSSPITPSRHDALVDLLRDRGFNLARRTVAKYREAIGIGSSVQRRRHKRLVRVG